MHISKSYMNFEQYLVLDEFKKYTHTVYTVYDRSCWCI